MSRCTVYYFSIFCFFATFTLIHIHSVARTCCRRFFCYVFRIIVTKRTSFFRACIRIVANNMITFRCFRSIFQTCCIAIGYVVSKCTIVYFYFPCCYKRYFFFYVIRKFFACTYTRRSVKPTKKGISCVGCYRKRDFLFIAIFVIDLCVRTCFCVIAVGCNGIAIACIIQL